MKQPGLSNAAAGKIPQICATSPASEKKIRSRPLAQPTIQGLNLITLHTKIRTKLAQSKIQIKFGQKSAPSILLKSGARIPSLIRE